jgi:hypothetical protein
MICMRQRRPSLQTAHHGHNQRPDSSACSKRPIDALPVGSRVLRSVSDLMNTWSYQCSHCT